MSRPSIMDRLRRMNQRSLFAPSRSAHPALPGQPETAPQDETPAAQTRAEALQRLQVGLFGIGAMVLLVGLASIIGSQADLAQEAAVPEAAPTTEPKPVASQANPLADAGVVPDIAGDPAPSPSATPLNLPPPPPGAQGAGNAAPQQ